MSDKIDPRVRLVEEAILSKIIPWVQIGAPLVMLEPPPFIVARGRQPGIIVRKESAPALTPQHGIGGDVRVRSWHDRNLNALNTPYWGCVMEGEADLVVGITKEMCDSCNFKPARWIVSLPEGTLFWIPPNVPITMNGLHWERPHSEKAHSRIFWMHITPTGANCHFCSTLDGKHWMHPSLFSSSPQLWALAQRIEQELKEQSRHYQWVLEHSLQLLLINTIRGLHERRALLSPSLDTSAKIVPGEKEHRVEQALNYINDCYSHLDLTTTDVARHVLLSPKHLTHLFQKHLHCSVRQVIVDIRIKQACHLLESSDFNVRQISVYCGYKHPATFIAAFEKRTGKSPLTYRHERQEDNNK